MDAALTDLSPCHYERLEDDIHQLTFQETSRHAVDAALGHLDRLMRETAPDNTVRIIVLNTNNKPQPVSYVVTKARSMMIELPQRAKLRAALVEEGFFATILDSVFRALLNRHDRLRVFGYAERDKMLEWLRRDD